MCLSPPLFLSLRREHVTRKNQDSVDENFLPHTREEVLPRPDQRQHLLLPHFFSSLASAHSYRTVGLRIFPSSKIELARALIIFLSFLLIFFSFFFLFFRTCVHRGSPLAFYDSFGQFRQLSPFRCVNFFRRSLIKTRTFRSTVALVWNIFRLFERLRDTQRSATDYERSSIDEYTYDLPSGNA